MAEAAIAADGVVKRLGPVTALDRVSFELPYGGVLGLLGPNGAGKTTMVRILATLLAPDAGTARVCGLEVTSSARAVRRLIGVSGQYAAVDPYLTGRENLVMIGRLHGLGRRAAAQRADELAGVLGLAEPAGRQARTYSGGMRRRLDVAASLVAAPRVLFLDEPTTGLDPQARLVLWQMLAGLAAQGMSLLLTTQYLEEADRLATRIVVLSAGRVIASGTPAELKASAGGDRLEVTARPGTDPARLAGALAGLGTAPPEADPAAGRVVLPVTAGPAILGEAAARLSAAAVPVAGLALRQPTLEEAFLALTAGPEGTGAGCQASQDSGQPARTRR
ncbi:MAG TPA: ATP-binding cassette domain-containing protein [Streptosporangiaceae bacterium]|nr:ATP-binding cassette domain-containing protein [Streptosporangiaceae bacterium]